MDLFFARGLGKLVSVPGNRGLLRELEVKRGDAVTVRLQFSRDGVAETLTGLWEIRMMLKETYAGEPLAQAFDWSEEDGIYSAELNTNTAEMLAALASSAALVTLGELTFTEDGGNWTSSQTLAVTVRNDVIKGDEDTPVNLPTPDDWLAARAVLYQEAQLLNTGEQSQARENIGVHLTQGGNGIDDEGRVPMYRSGGGLRMTGYADILDPADESGIDRIGLSADAGNMFLYVIRDGLTMNVQFPALTGTRFLTFPDRTGTIATLSGNQAFTGQITLPNQTAATSDAVITRELDAAEVLWNLHRVVRLPYFINSVSGTGAGAAAHQTMGVSLNCGTSNGSYARAFVGPQINTDPQSTGGVITASQRLRFAAVGEFQALDVANGGKLRFLVGVGAVAPVLADANAFSAAGFGIEWQWSVANSRTEVRLISHNGTTFQASAWVPFRSGYQRRCAFLLDHVGDGSLNLYVAENGPFNLGCPRPGSTPAATLTGVPTGALGGGYVALDAVAASAASAPSITSGLRFKLRDILLLTD